MPPAMPKSIVTLIPSHLLHFQYEMNINVDVGSYNISKTKNVPKQAFYSGLVLQDSRIRKQ